MAAQVGFSVSTLRPCQASPHAWVRPASSSGSRSLRAHSRRLRALKIEDGPPPPPPGPPKPKKDKKKHKEEELEEDLLKQDGPGLEAEQVESLLETLCEGTDLAQLELVLPGFKLRVRRSLAGSAAAAPAITLVSPVVPVAAAAPAPAAPAPAAPTPAASSDEEDESHLPVLATRVGLFRRGRYVKGKRVGKGPMVNPGDSVKKGQVVAFVEQLGTYWPIEAPQSGEIAAFLVEEGEPVEYHQAVLELAPFFGDHIIGDRINR